METVLTEVDLVGRLRVLEMFEASMLLNLFHCLGVVILEIFGSAVHMAAFETPLVDRREPAFQSVVHPTVDLGVCILLAPPA